MSGSNQNYTGVGKYLSLGFENVSSGEMALMSQIVHISESVKALSKNFKEIVVLIDEGDAFLHLQWQQSYINTLNEIMKNLKVNEGLSSLQIILASHSPILATDVPKDFICRMDENTNGNLSGFAAPLYALLSDSFGTNTIGEFSAKKITQVIENIKNGRLSEMDEMIISVVDNPVIKAELHRLINERKRDAR
ncbi:AAA family ATPase [Pantoea sp. NPDC088449]|uniref:AAA family ATPase n=1 Tax=Pantoea sp. NPDC088449 TaxID=3364392 RepID=UPI0037FEAA43